MTASSLSATTWPLSTDCVPGQSGWAAAAVSSDATVWAVPTMDAAQQASDGGAVGPTSVCSSRDGTHWRLALSIAADPEIEPGMLTVSGRHVAVIMTGTGSATVMPVVALWTTTDGIHWLERAHPPFDQIDSMAATSGGVLFAASGDGTLYRSEDWSTFTRAEAPKVWDLEPDGAAVAGRLATDVTPDVAQEPALVTIADSGAVSPWPTPLR